MKIIQLNDFRSSDDYIDLSKSSSEKVSAYFSSNSSKRVCIYDLRRLGNQRIKQEIRSYIEHIVSNQQFSKESFRQNYLYWLIHFLEIGINKDIASFATLSQQDIDIIIANVNESTKKNILKWGICRLIRFTISNLSSQERFDCDWWFINEDISLKGNFDKAVSFFNISSELKIDLKKFMQDSLSNYKGKCISGKFLFPFKILLKYIIENQISSIEDIDIKTYCLWLDKNGHRSKNKDFRRPVNLSIFDHYYKWKNAESSKAFYNRDYWLISQLNIEKERLNKTLKVNSLRFSTIENVANRELIKKYIWYLISETAFALSTIKHELTLLKRFCSLCDDDFDHIEREKVFQIIDKITHPKDRQVTLGVLKKMFLYLYEDKYLPSPILYASDVIRVQSPHINRVVEKSVVSQIFSKLDQFPEDLVLIYLILYCTGLRISEVLLLKSDCLYKNKNGFLIKSYSVKMRKDQFSAIPLELYALLDAYIKNITASDSNYIFRSKRFDDEPMSPSYVNDHLNTLFEQLQIVCEDGSIYKIDIHAYRHRFGTNLHEYGISPYIIQKALHHKSIEMTMAYIDFMESDVKNGYENFYNNVGEKVDMSKADNRVILDYLSKEFRVQALPNGVCGLPTKLGKCEHANACLQCEYFRTKRIHIGILKRQLAETEENLCDARKNGWVMQIATNEEVETNLRKIICSIENEGHHQCK